MSAADASYNGSDAITVYAVEARSENALYVSPLFRHILLTEATAVPSSDQPCKQVSEQ